jgi:hypothetical protein
MKFSKRQEEIFNMICQGILLFGIGMPPYYLTQSNREYLGEHKVMTLEMAGLIVLPSGTKPLVDYDKKYLDKIWKLYLEGKL